MKHKYLSLIALAAAMTMSTSAWAVDPPTEVEPGYTTEWTTPEDGGIYFIYNVGADQYLGAGNNWGTHVVTATETEDVILRHYWDDDVALSGGQFDMGSGMILPMKLTKTEEGTFYIEHLGTNRTACFLSSEDGNSWIDCNEARRIDFIITPVDGGYTIQATNTVEAETYFGAVDPEEEPTDGVVVRNVMNNVTAETGHIIWRFAPTNYNECKSYEVRYDLYDKIVEAQGLGINTSAAESVYGNSNATAEEIQEAIIALTLAINQQQFAELFAGASEDQPLDVTVWAIENPNFDSSIDGWTITVGGQNLQWQARTDGTVDESKNWVQITNFIEAWRPAPAALGDGTISQTIYGLPQGKYVLECDAMATLQGGSPDPESAVENAFIFIQGDENEVRSAIKSPDTQPKHWSVTFISPEGNKSTTLGLKVESTTANWISADNFKLTYYGPFEGIPEMAELQTAINNAMSSVEKIESGIYMASAEATSNFEEALANAQTVVASEVMAEEYTAAREALEAAQKDYEASVLVYEEIGKFIGADGSACKLDEYMEMAGNWVELYDELEEWENELRDGYQDGTLTAERFAEIRDGFLTKIREFIKKEGNIQPGDDITMLLDNPDFSEGNGRNLTNDAVPGWTITSGGLTELRSVTGNIEKYHEEGGTGLDMHQTITDMPAGIYDITVQGFVRHDGTDTDKTVFYAGDVTTTLMTLEDQWSLEPIWLETTDEKPAMGDTNHDLTLTTPSGATAYKANGMTGAYYWFQTPITDATDFKYNPQDGDNFYTNHIKVYLREKGDFTIGIKTTSTTDWVIWDNFQIRYIGEDLDIYIQMVQDAFETLQNAYLANDAFITAKAEADYAAVETKVADVKNIATSEEALELIDEIDNVLAYVNEGNKLGATLTDTYYLYSENLMPTVNSSDKEFPTLINQIGGIVTNPAQIADNESIEPLIVQLKKGWTKFVMADHIANASEETPQDVTAVIYNPDYTDYNLPNSNEGKSSEGWTNAKGSIGLAYEEAEFFNQTFNHYQSIIGLEPGYYEVGVEGFYRAGGYAAAATAQRDSADARNTILYAAVGTDTITVSKPIHSIFDGAYYEEDVEGGLGVGDVQVEIKDNDGNIVTKYVPNSMEGASSYFGFERPYLNTIIIEVREDGILTIGLRKDEQLTDDWTIFTNWTLTYYGKEVPSAVESIQTSQNVKASQIFGIDGRQQPRLQRGINIVRMADGSVRKVLVK